MFTGIGGFEKGIQQAYDASNKQSATIKQDRQGRNRNTDEVEHDVLPTGRIAPLCVGYSEIDRYAIKVYERHYGHTNYGNATTINPTELPDFDLLVGGFPCQAFSIAGKRRGLDDARGTLFFDIARILEAKRPRHFVLENVKGLLSSRTTVSKEIIIEELYKECVANIKLNQHIPIGEWQTITDNLSVYLQSIGGTSGLLKSWRYLLMEVLQITKKQNSYLTEKMRLSGLNEDEWVSTLEKLYSINSLSNSDIPILEKMVAMNADVVSLLKNQSEEKSDRKKLYTISTDANQMTDQRTCMSALIEMNITSFITKQWLLSNNLWKKIESGSRKEGTYYVKTLNIIISELKRLRYDVEWQTLNSKDFGVPQNRERIYFIGHLRGECSGEVLPITGSSQQIASVAGYISEEVWPRRHEQIRRVYKTDGAMPTIPTGQGGGVMTKIVAQRGRYNEDGKTEQQLEPRPDDITNTLTAVQKDNLVAVDLTRRADGNHRVRKDGRAGTLDANYYKGLANQERPGVKDGLRIRRLTPLECERLQGFPDSWTAGESDTQRYKMCGNAVTVNTVEAVITNLIKHMED
jgi:DNA-cytosine methyltransferase